MRVSISTLKGIQRDLDLGHTHVVHLNERGFTIAHTCIERVAHRRTQTPLTDCPLHLWLSDLDEVPENVGLYIVEPYDDEGYRFEALSL